MGSERFCPGCGVASKAHNNYCASCGAASVQIIEGQKQARKTGVFRRFLAGVVGAVVLVVFGLYAYQHGGTIETSRTQIHVKSQKSTWGLQYMFDYEGHEYMARCEQHSRDEVRGEALEKGILLGCEEINGTVNLPVIEVEAPPFETISLTEMAKMLLPHSYSLPSDYDVIEMTHTPGPLAIVYFTQSELEKKDGTRTIQYIHVVSASATGQGIDRHNIYDELIFHIGNQGARLSTATMPLHSGASLEKLEPQGYVNDFANVLSQEDRARLEKLCNDLDQRRVAQLAVLTLSDLQGKEINDVSIGIARRWGVGHKGLADGLLLLIATKDHKVRLEVGSGLTAVIPTSEASEIVGSMTPDLHAERYGNALIKAVEEIGTKLPEDSN